MIILIGGDQKKNFERNYVRTSVHNIHIIQYWMYRNIMVLFIMFHISSGACLGKMLFKWLKNIILEK